MKTTKKLVIAAAVLPMVFATASVSAFGGKGGKHKDFDRSLMRQLDLTVEQQQQLRDMREARRAERDADREARFAEKAAHREAVQALVLADNFDQTAAQELAQAMVEKQTERRVQKLAHQHEMLSVLTAEQKEQWQALHAERMEKMAQKKGRKQAKERY